jgi:hypothetical protein
VACTHAPMRTAAGSRPPGRAHRATGSRTHAPMRPCRPPGSRSTRGQRQMRAEGSGRVPGGEVGLKRFYLQNPEAAPCSPRAHAPTHVSALPCRLICGRPLLPAARTGTPVRALSLKLLHLQLKYSRATFLQPRGGSWVRVRVSPRVNPNPNPNP